MEHWFSAGGRFGTAKLIRKNRKYYLHIPVTLEAENRNILNHIVGIDRAKALALRKRLQTWDKISKVETEEAP